MKESSAYIEDSGISRKRQCFALSYYLTDKAYDFYQQKVSMTEEKWTLEEFYTELFNFCFPINYRTQMRKKVDHLFQKEKTVNQYAFELEEMYNMIGGYSKRDKVIKLWNGLRRSIQAALYNDKLNPEISSWRKVLAAAEIIEIAEKINGPSKEGRTDAYSGSVVPLNKGKRHHGKSKKGFKDSFRRGSSNQASGSHLMPPPIRKNSFPRHSSRDNHSQSSRGQGGHSRFGSTPRREFVKKEPVNYGLSEKEKAARLTDGRCFRCNETGHIGRNCPSGITVKHSGNKPPGVSNFNMEIIEEIVPSDSNSAEVLDSLPLGHITFENDDETDSSLSPNPWPTSRPSWMNFNKLKPRNKIGDALAMVAEYILSDIQPFPGDNYFLQLQDDSWEVDNRFSVTQRPGDTKNYMVHDFLTNFQVKISKKSLADDSFDLGQWYTRKRLRHLNRDVSSNVPIRKMTEPWSIVARFLLINGICSSYPNIEPNTLSEFRFYVEKSRDKLGFYEIDDEDLEITTLIAAETLENPTFDLVKWYQDELDEGELYNEAYTKSILQEKEQSASSDSEPSEFSDAESVLSVLLDMFDEDLDQESDFNELPELQPVSNTDSDDESQTAPEGGSYSNFEPSMANLEPNSLEARSNEVESGSVSDMETGSDSGSSLGDLTGYELGKVGDILAWKVREVLTHCQPFPDDETEALPSEFFDGKPRFEVTRGEEFPDDDMYTISDHFRGIIASIHIAHLRHDTFSIGKWYAEICAKKGGDHRPSVVQEWMQQREYHETIMGAVREQYTAHLLEMACPFAFEDDDIDRLDKRFDVRINCQDITHLVIEDKFRHVVSHLPRELIEDPEFDLINWYEFRLAQFELDQFDFVEEKIQEVATDESTWPRIWNVIQEMMFSVPDNLETGGLELNGVQVARDKYPAVQRNAASVKDKTQVLPKPVTLTVKIDGHPARALVDSGSLGDFMSTNLADQLNVKREELEVPLGLQLAVQGSRSKINFRAKSRFQYQEIDEERQFDIINLSNYDLILGTPWMYQHQVCLGFNPARVVIGTDTALPIKKGADTKLMVQAIDVGTDELEQAREELRQYAEPLCKKLMRWNYRRFVQ
jgi:hypothetical protein